MSTGDNSGLFGCRPVLCVESIAQEHQYYVGVLGFRLGSGPGPTRNSGFCTVVSHLILPLHSSGEGRCNSCCRRSLKGHPACGCI